ncbi:GGDEF domain-containing protein [Natronospirillum operosum]|uniref:diguanylate cyclase n=1 Tax=Natronospirillum operosum TaxID=2759953 RepID=A0A4Z0W3I8_9GAMM|nr:GGDEF domain-containing protein [Natronospirillum operosum]TGG91678.1 GGDEF domain-containing protein [Natronospirillum operosum]
MGQYHGDSGTTSGIGAVSNEVPAGRDAWRWLLLGGLILTLFYVVIPYGRLASAVYVVTTALAAIAVILAVKRRLQLFRPAAWRLIASALALAACGHAVWYWLDLRGLEPFPSLADAFYLAVYPLFMAALWMLGQGSGRDEGALSDALIVGIAAAVPGWALLIAPYLEDPNLTLVQLLVATAYPVADLIMLPLALRLVFLHRGRVAAHLFLLWGMLAYMAADLLYAHGNSAGWYGPGGLTDGLWLVAYVLIVAAIWHPSAASELRSHVSIAELSGRRLVVLGAASMLAPSVILVTAGVDVEVVRVAAIGSILLFLLVMHRMAGLMRKTHRQADELAKLSRTDPLTGAANRRQLDVELEREMSRARRSGLPLTLAFIDLDHFKRYNDTHGHNAGDALLETLVDGWRPVLRDLDLLARIGGEEFVVVMPDTDVDEARRVVERMRQRIPQQQTCSAGIADYRAGDTAEMLLARADRAMYAAKHNGRNQVALAEKESPH